VGKGKEGGWEVDFNDLMGVEIYLGALTGSGEGKGIVLWASVNKLT
jgi:hypothetical protein